MSALPKRRLGRSGIQVSAMGLGCWAIGGPFWRGETPVGWGVMEDEESIHAIHRGLELGIDFFDTADVYGAGHSERVLGRALAGRRDRVVIATKFGNIFDEATRQVTSESASPDHIRRACEASLRRTADKPVPFEVTAKVAAPKISRSKLIRYEGASHGILVTEQERVATDLLAFLRA
jgi:aryl-alcohol dehydrogenase-like predicted oxidoreductase